LQPAAQWAERSRPPGGGRPYGRAYDPLVTLGWIVVCSPAA